MYNKNGDLLQSTQGVAFRTTLNFSKASLKFKFEKLVYLEIKI